MIRRYPPYGIQGEPEPSLLEAMITAWQCPAVRLFVVAVVLVTMYLLGFVVGSRCEATRQLMLG